MKLREIFLFILLLFVSLSSVYSLQEEQAVVLFERYEESTVMVYQGLFFNADKVTNTSIFRKIEDKYDVSILDIFVTLSSGSGFFITKKGHIVTNHHVTKVDDLKKIRDNFYDITIKEFFSKIPKSIISNSEYKVLKSDFRTLVDESEFSYGAIINNKDRYVIELLQSDKDLDVALLKISKPDKNFPPVFLGDSDTLKVGQQVIAIGYPIPSAFASFKDFRSSMTSGNVSAIRSDAWGIQHTASISPGNSGGPLFNIKGDLIGINVGAITTGNNIFFSIPSNKFKEWLGSSEYANLVDRNAKEARRLGTMYDLNKDGFLETGSSILIRVAEGYDIILDGEKIGVTPLFLEGLAAGEHILRIESEIEFKEHKILVVEERPDTFTYEPVLEKYSGKLYVASIPTGADIFIRDKKYGTTPFVIDFLPIGDYMVTLKKQDHFPEEFKATIQKDKTSRMEKELKKAYIISFTTELPAGSTVLINGEGKSFSYTSGEKIILYKGEWEIIVFGDKFESKIFNISISDSDIALTFDPVYNYAVLKFENLIEGSTVKIDGEDQTANINNNKLEVSTGEHTVTVTTADNGYYEKTVNLEGASETTIEVTYTLSKEYYEELFTTKINTVEDEMKKGRRNKKTTDNLKALEIELKASDYSLPEHEARINLLIIESIGNDEAVLEQRIESAEKGKTFRNIMKWTTLGTSIVCTGVAIAGLVNAESAYQDYLAAEYTADAIKYREQSGFLDILSYVSGGAGAVSLGVSLVFWIGEPNIKKMETKLDRWKSERARREGK